MMKQYMKSVMTMALMLLFTSGAWAADVTIKKQLNGTATETGTATKSISEGVCTLTVTPPAGSYVTKDFITAYAVWNGNMAQTPRRNPGLVDNPIAVTASDASADPSGETKYTLTLPTDGSDVEVTVNFQSRKLLTLDMVEDIDDFIFNWEGHEPELIIKDGNDDLVKGTHYTVELSDTVNAGTAKATITGKGIYTTISDGATSIVKTFTINPMDLSEEEIVGELTATNFEYDGEKHMPALGGISYNNHNLVNEVDYWLAYPDSVNAGIGKETEVGGASGPRCEITGKGNFTGKVIRYYTIAQADFNVEIADIPEQTATGEPIEPELTVTFKNTNNKTITVDASDYTAEYSNNVNPGTATVILSSTGNNFKTELTQTKTFIINGIENYLSIKDGEAFLSKLRVTNGNTFDVKAHYQVVCPEDIPAADLTWKSDDETVASVNNNGVITAEGYGNAKITLAYAGGGKYAEDTYDFYVDAAPKTPTVSLPAGAYPSDQGAITMTKENVAGMAISYTWDDITGDNAAAWSNYADEGVAFQEGTLSARVGYTFTKGGITSTVYSDTVSVAYTYLIDIATCTVTGNDDQTYNGAAHTPELTVTPAGGGTALTLDTDYTVSYKKGDAAVESMIDAGDYTIVITAKEGSLYEGSKEVDFTIIPKTIVADWVTLAQDTYDYTGEEVKAEVKVTDSDRGVDLTLDTDFTVAYSNNVAVGTATASVTGTGNYTGSKTATFTIGAADITDLYDISLDETSYVYDGTEHKPAVVFMMDNEPVELSADDYEVSYSNNVNVGSADATTGAPTVIVSGKGNLTGSKTLTFSITAMSLENATVTVDASQTYTYTGSEINPNVTVSLYLNDVLTMLTTDDYTVSYTNNVNAATADAETNAPTVTVTGKGNYTGSASGTFTIEKATPIITFVEASYSATLGETFTSPATVDNWDVSPTTSSNTSVATISEGLITLVGVGTTTITVTYAGDANHNSATGSYELVVSSALGITFEGSNLWASYYATETLSVPDGLTAYVVNAVDEETGSVTVASVDYIPANNAVLLKRANDGAASGYTAVAYTGTTATVSNLLGGSINTTAISSFGNNPVYVLFNDKFKRAISGTIPARRAYLALGAAIASAGAPQYLTIVDGNTTAIETLAVDDSNDSWYTIDGLKLNGKPQRKGLYIIKGKKVYINNNK